MSDFKLPQSVLSISSGPSYFGTLSGTKKDLELKDVTRIDFPLIEKGKIDQEGLEHALVSLEQKELALVIADDIFMHHIADYTLTAGVNIDEKITQTVSEVFKDQADPLHIVTVDLAKTSKIQTIQITALTKENAEAIVKAAQKADITITQVIPASFVVKAFVSVDPSLFILQTPEYFLLTSHYIGVDYADKVEHDDLKKLTSSIKQLKKERPHIQHAYLCTEPDQYETVSSELEDIIPLQQVVIEGISTEKDTPIALKAMVMGYKEVLENDFPLPQFDLSSIKIENTSAEQEEASDIEKVHEKKEEELAIEQEPNKKDPTSEDEEDDLIAKLMDKKEKKEEKEEKKDDAEDNIKTILPPPTKPVEVKATNVIIPPKIISAPIIGGAASVTSASIVKPAVVSVPSDTTTPTISKVITTTSTQEVKTIAAPEKVSTVTSSMPEKKKRSIISYIMLATGVALVISLIGGGFVISQQALSMKQDGGLKTPIAEVTETPEEVTPTPEPTPKPIDLSELDILVVNATTVAGKAGKTATLFKDAGVKSTATGNAKGDYEKGTYIMFADEDMEDSLAQIEKEVELKFKLLDYTTVEDLNKKYDVIVVLAE